MIFNRARHAWIVERTATLVFADRALAFKGVADGTTRSEPATIAKTFAHFREIACADAERLGGDIRRFHPGLPIDGDAGDIVESLVGLKNHTHSRDAACWWANWIVADSDSGIGAPGKSPAADGGARP